jgi:Domain of unknown function (DUF5658)
LGPLSKSLLLFAMNGIDAQLTLLWIRLNVATEGNSLMARLLNHGEGSFLGVKLIVGAFAAYVLYRCSHVPLARRGMTFVLVVYAGLMLIHTATGCLALGWHGPIIVLGYFGTATQTFLGLFS